MGFRVDSEAPWVCLARKPLPARDVQEPHQVKHQCRAASCLCHKDAVPLAFRGHRQSASPTTAALPAASALSVPAGRWEPRPAPAGWPQVSLLSADASPSPAIAWLSKQALTHECRQACRAESELVLHFSPAELPAGERGAGRRRCCSGNNLELTPGAGCSPCPTPAEMHGSVVWRVPCAHSLHGSGTHGGQAHLSADGTILEGRGTG